MNYYTRACVYMYATAAAAKRNKKSILSRGEPDKFGNNEILDMCNQAQTLFVFYLNERFADELFLRKAPFRKCRARIYIFPNKPTCLLVDRVMAISRRCLSSKLKCDSRM